MTDPNSSGTSAPSEASSVSNSGESALEVRAAGSPPLADTAPLSSGSPSSLGRGMQRPSFIFFGLVAAISLMLDVASKAWAEIELSKRGVQDVFHVIEGHLSLELAYNRGGAWSLLQNAHEQVRRPFFLLVSLLAIVFIISIYSRLQRRQWALVWGLPLVFGGALGNFADRLVRGSVVDFIAYRADWIMSMNRTIARFVPGWGVTDHWPTFNVADISICLGVCLMALDMLISKRGHSSAPTPPPSQGVPSVFGVGASSKPPSAMS